jgi:hypothetical protein
MIGQSNAPHPDYSIYTGQPTLKGMNQARQGSLTFWTPCMRVRDIAVKHLSP